jgi:hypothetical protein
MALLRQLHSIMNHKKHGKFTSDEPIWTETMEYSWANREHHDLPWLALTDDAESKPHNPVLTRWLYTYPAIKWVLEHWEALLLYSGFQKDACGNADWQKAAWSQVHKMLLASDMRLTLTFLYNFYDNFLAEEFHYAMGKPRNALFQTDRVLQRERVLRAAAQDPESFLPQTFEALTFLQRPDRVAGDGRRRQGLACELNQVDTIRQKLLQAESDKRLTLEEGTAWKQRIVNFLLYACSKNEEHAGEWKKAPAVLGLAGMPPAAGNHQEGRGQDSHFARALLDVLELEGGGGAAGGGGRGVVREENNYYDTYFKLLQADSKQLLLYVNAWGLNDGELLSEWRSLADNNGHIHDGTLPGLKVKYDDIFNVHTQNQIVEHDFSIYDTYTHMQKMGQKTRTQAMMFNANKKQDLIASMDTEKERQRDVRKINGKQNTVRAKQPLTMLNPAKRDFMLAHVLKDSEAYNNAQTRRLFADKAHEERNTKRKRKTNEFKNTNKLAQRKKQRFEAELAKIGSEAYMQAVTGELKPVPILYKQAHLTVSQYNEQFSTAHALALSKKQLVPGIRAEFGGRHKMATLEQIIAKRAAVEKRATTKAERERHIREKGGGGHNAVRTKKGGGAVRTKKCSTDGSSDAPKMVARELEKLTVSELKDELKRRGWKPKGDKAGLVSLLERAVAGEDPSASERYNAPVERGGAGRTKRARKGKDPAPPCGHDSDSDEDEPRPEWQYTLHGVPCSEDEYVLNMSLLDHVEMDNSEEDEEVDDAADADVADLRRKISARIRPEVDALANDTVVTELIEKGCDTGGRTMSEVCRKRNWDESQVRGALIDVRLEEKLKEMQNAKCEHCGCTETPNEELDPLLFCDTCDRTYCLTCIKLLDASNVVLDSLDEPLECPCCASKHRYDVTFGPADWND